MNQMVYLPAWKLQYVRPTNNISLSHEDYVFYGLGSCPVKRVAPEDLEKANTPEAIVRFYMKLLRTWCLETEFDAIMTMINDKVLQIENKALRIPPGSFFM